MADEFSPITTQEEFDNAVRERYGDVAGLQSQVTTLTKERDTNAQKVTELTNQVKTHEVNALKVKIAHEKGIPHEMALRLSGETEADIRSDADAISKYLAPATPGSIRKGTHTKEGGKPNTDAAYEKLLNNLEGEE